MEIVNLVRRDSLSLENRKSYVRESALDGLARGKVLAGHKADIGCGRAEGQPVAFVVSAHAGEARAAGNLAFEMVDVGHLHIGLGRLVMIAVLVQPWNRKWARASVKRSGGNGRAAILSRMEPGYKRGQRADAGYCRA
jgi:hypothetical protein